MAAAPPKTDGVRAKAAAMLALGASVVEICGKLDIHRATLWSWRRDPEFAAMVDEIVQVGLTEAGQQLRALAPLAVEAFERGLRSAQDDALAVRTADIVTRRIPELMPRAGVDVEVDTGEKLVELIRRLDARNDPAGDDRDPSLPPPPRSAIVRADQPLDPNQA